MKLMASGVMNWAAMTRSPSFSRSSSSTTTTILPAAMSSNASSMVENSISARVGNELLHVFREDVNLEVDLAAGLGLPQRRPLLFFFKQKTAYEMLFGGVGTDQVFGQAGDDLMIWNPGEGTDLNEGGAGNDTVV